MEPNTTTSSTPAQALRAQWMTMVRALILSEGALDVSMDWLSCHPDYDPTTFWTAPGKDGLLALPEAFVHGKHEIFVLPRLTPFVEKLASPEVLDAQYNTPSEGGKVLLQLIWEARRASLRARTSNGLGYGSTDDLAKQWLDVLDRTHPRFWTFLDRSDEQPGAGMRRTMMDILAQSPSTETAAMANGTMERLTRIYPARAKVGDPKDSPWRTALSEPQIEALATLGHRLDEPVGVGALEVPAWEWLLMNRGAARAHGIASAVDKLAKRQGLLPAIEAARQKDPDTPQWTSISPNDRRATSGYVAKVIKFTQKDGTPCFDRYGRSPLDYLLTHRSDLFGMFAGSALRLPTEEFVARFAQPDRAGVPAVLRYLQRLPADQMSTFQHLMERHGCWTPPEQLLVERGGLLAWEKEIAGWRQAQAHHGAAFPVEKIVRALSDPAVVFGPPAQQQQWRQWWEDNFSNWPGMREWLSKGSPHDSRSASLLAGPAAVRFYRQAVLHLDVFLANGQSNAWRSRLDPALWSTLQVAACALTTLPGTGSNKTSPWFSGVAALSHEAATAAPTSTSRFADTSSLWSVRLSRNPPQSPTPTLIEALATPVGQKVLAALDGSCDLPGRTWNFKETRESWAAWHRREHLMLSVPAAARSDSRMKM